jgi:hypothetical protein
VKFIGSPHWPLAPSYAYCIISAVAIGTAHVRRSSLTPS